MKIKLKRDWFTPDGTLLRAGERTVPDEYANVLPTGTKVLEGAEDKQAKLPLTDKADDKKKA